MSLWLSGLAATAVFLVGLRLSAFFSGTETGFYRLSVPRLTIDARAGDRTAGRLLWFARHPQYFVATCLIGNNIANYLCTFAINWGVVSLAGSAAASWEVIVSIIFTPVIFLLGELLPKSLYYMVPLSRLRKEAHVFRFIFRLLLPLSWPLVVISRLLERLTRGARPGSEVLLGRNHLAQLMQHGRREGALTDLQSRLASGVLQLAPQGVTLSMIPSARVLGVSETATRTEMVDFARRFGLSVLAVHRAPRESAWYGYVYVSELLLSAAATPTIYAMPVLSREFSKLEALYELQSKDASYGVVKNGDEVLGVVSRNGLVEQVFRPHAATAAAATA